PGSRRLLKRDHARARRGSPDFAHPAATSTEGLPGLGTHAHAPNAPFSYDVRGLAAFSVRNSPFSVLRSSFIASPRKATTNGERRMRNGERRKEFGGFTMKTTWLKASLL